jgi:hypothetical protein
VELFGPAQAAELLIPAANMEIGFQFSKGTLGGEETRGWKTRRRQLADSFKGGTPRSFNFKSWHMKGGHTTGVTYFHFHS